MIPSHRQAGFIAMYIQGYTTIYPCLDCHRHGKVYIVTMSVNSAKTGAEMRAAARFPVHWPVQMEDETAVTRDISASGMYLKCATSMQPNATFHFSVQFPKRAGVVERLECEGRAIRVERTPDGWFGVAVALLTFQFHNLNTLPM